MLKRLSVYDPQHKRVRDQFEGRLANHVINENKSRSFTFHEPHLSKSAEKKWVGEYPFAKLVSVTDKARFSWSSTYAYTLTWNAGHMTLSGDLGELVIVHYHAMDTFENALGWCQSSDFSYLMSKTNVKRVYDKEGTVTDVWRMLTEQCLDDMKYRRDEMKLWREDYPKPKWNKRAGMKKKEYDRLIKDWLDERPWPPKITETRHHDLSYSNKRRSRLHQHHTQYDVPDSWWGLYELWVEYHDDIYMHDDKISPFDPNIIFTAHGRRELKEAMESAFNEMMEGDIVDVIQRMGLDDYYGSYTYSEHCVFQIMAIREGCAKISEIVAKEKADG